MYIKIKIIAEIFLACSPNRFMIIIKKSIQSQSFYRFEIKIIQIFNIIQFKKFNEIISKIKFNIKLIYYETKFFIKIKTIAQIILNCLPDRFILNINFADGKQRYVEDVNK